MRLEIITPEQFVERKIDKLIDKECWATLHTENLICQFNEITVLDDWYWEFWSDDSYVQYVHGTKNPDECKIVLHWFDEPIHDDTR